MKKSDTVQPFLTFDATWSPTNSERHQTLPDNETRAIITSALQNWINTPTKSLFQALAVQPEPGQPVFSTHLDQTRFLIELRNTINQMRNHPSLYQINPDSLPKLPTYSTVIENGQRIKIANDAHALTLEDRSHPLVQIILQTLHAYAEQQQKLNPKLRRLYRGLRLQHIHHKAPAANDILAMLPHIEKAVESRHDHRQRNLALSIIRQITGQYVLAHQPLVNLSNNRILSFTSREETARYFTKKQGIIISTEKWSHPPEIISSSDSEELLQENDPVSRRRENLTILRIPQEIIIPEEAIIPYDFSYFHATGDIRAINALDTPYTSITYELDGHRITKSVSYISDRETRAYYRHDNDYGHGLKDFTKKFGISPTITAANSKRAKIISITSCQPYSDKTKPNNPLPQDMIKELQEATRTVLTSQMS